MTRRFALLFGLSLLLTGCADLAPTTKHAEQPTSAYKESIDIEGRMSVKYRQNDQDESLNGNFVWSQNGKRTAITLRSPLGQTIALIEVTPDKSVLTQSGKPKRIATHPDTLTELALGWPLPIAGMRDWLQGVATDTQGQRFVASSKSDAAAMVSTQDGWRIRYVSWEDAENTPSSNRPKRIDLVRNTAQVGDVSIRLVIDSWQPH